MKSHIVLKHAIQTIGAKSISSDMHLSASLVYKWCQPHSSPDDGGADNPLDRVLRICELTGTTAPVDWLCEQTGGFRVQNPKGVSRHEREPVLSATQGILKEFSDVIEAVSESYRNQQRVDRKEAERIRKEWEELKRVGETFVAACEAGAYAQGEKGN